MATYVISDLHGCKSEFDTMLDRISFSQYDELWILGDVCDRGPLSIPLLLEIMDYPNMHLIFGNHDDWLAAHIQEIIDAKKNNGSFQLTEPLQQWLHYHGGFVTADGLMDLELPQCYDIKLYLENPIYYKELTVQGKKYLLVHAGLGKNCTASTHISSIPADTLMWEQADLEENPYPDTTLIVGHRPTFFFGEQYDGKIIHGTKKNTLHIDCGCIFGRTLGCICLEDEKEFYIPSTYPRMEYSKRGS